MQILEAYYVYYFCLSKNDPKSIYMYWSSVDSELSILPVQILKYEKITLIVNKGVVFVLVWFVVD